MKYTFSTLFMVAMVVATGLCGLQAGKEILLSWNGESQGLSDFFAISSFCGLFVVTAFVIGRIKNLRPEENQTS